jgi:tRNA uridine 5-carboxymethylaminomethyl modification enzyme
LVRRSIDFSKTEVQRGDDPVPFFSFWLDELFHVEQNGRGTGSHGCRMPSILSQLGNQQLPCHLTHTTAETVDVIRRNLHRSAMYSGAIKGIGPRYCPSIEDKIVKFSEKESHQIFLEPEGIGTDEIYVNGLSTSLPYDVQIQLVRTIRGCENAEIMRPAYAVEYDFAQPTQLYPSLETKQCRNLFFAGQINGTSGYEEAAAQGLVAGINAARRVRGLEPVVLSRDQAYIGVLIDDLTTKGTTEPYRMFTSRAEYRLLLRQDNADLRLSHIGHDIGLLAHSNHERVCQKHRAISEEVERLQNTRIGKNTLDQLLRRSDVFYADLPSTNPRLSAQVIQQVELTIKYSGYLARQELEIQKQKTLEGRGIPSTFDYHTVIGLRRETLEKLKAIRPCTVGQASRISGVSPADISLLLVHLHRGNSRAPR